MFSYQAALVYKPAENGSIYFSYSDARQPQALTSTSTGAGGTAINPTLKNNSMELGTKWNVLGERLALTAALFRTERTNEVIETSTGVNEAVGKRRVQGLELSATGEITDAWNLYAAYSYMDSKIVRAAATGNGPLTEGESLTQTPPHNISLWTTYEFPFGLEIGGGANYVGKRQAINSTTTRPGWSFSDYWLVSALVKYEITENLALQLNVNNIFNEKYYERPRVTGSYAFAVPGEGRNAMLTLNVRY